MRLNYSIIFVSDMSRSVSLYRDMLEIPLTFESPGWTEFNSAGATLALHKSDSANLDDTNNELEPAGRCRPGFQVSNLAEFHQRMVEKNVHCPQAPTRVFGALIAQYVDPDGLTFSVSEERQGK